MTLKSTCLAFSNLTGFDTRHMMYMGTMGTVVFIILVNKNGRKMTRLQRFVPLFFCVDSFLTIFSNKSIIKNEVSAFVGTAL